MGDFKMGNNTVLTQSGTAKPTFGSGAPTGAVIRVFYQTSTGDITVSSGTTIVTVTQTLTPLSDTSKFLIMYSCNGRFNSGTDTAFEMQVYKGGSAIGGMQNSIILQW